MKIYFAGSISGGREYLETYSKMVEFIQNHDHIVLTEHIIHPKVFDLEKEFTDEQIYDRDILWLNECDCVVAEVSNPSLGVGYEIGYALDLEKSVLCLYHKNVFLSRMLTGNHRPGLRVVSYEDDDGWKKNLGYFLRQLE